MRDMKEFSLEHLIERIDEEIEKTEELLDTLDEVTQAEGHEMLVRSLDNLNKQRRELMIND